MRNADLEENTGKSNWVPSQCLAWLGFVIDLERGKVIVPNEKLDALHVQLRQALLSKFLPVRSIASITHDTLGVTY